MRIANVKLERGVSKKEGVCDHPTSNEKKTRLKPKHGFRTKAGTGKGFNFDGKRNEK